MARSYHESAGEVNSRTTVRPYGVARWFAHVRMLERLCYRRCMSDSDLLCLDLPVAERARAAQPSLDELEALSSQARALSDPTRLAIALALRDCGSACGCDVAWVVGRDDKLVSHHLRTLKNAGAATSHRDGKMVMYELTPACRALLTTLIGPDVPAAKPALAAARS